MTKNKVGKVRSYNYKTKNKKNGEVKTVKKYYIDTFDEKGKRIRLYGFDTQSAANNHLAEITSDKVNNNFIYSSKDCIFDFLAQNCLDNYCKTLKDSTYKTYLSMNEKHFKEYFNGMRFENITASTLNNFYIEKREEGLSDKTIYNLRAFLSTIFTFNIKDNKITTNPVNTSVKIEYDTEEVIPYTPSEQKALLEAAKNFKDAYYIIKLFLETGMRRGELIAFEITKIDRLKRQYKLRYSSYNKKLVKPKTKQGVRNIDLSPKALQVIDEYIRIRKVESNFLFSAPDGGLRCADAIGELFERVKKAAGITHGSLHTLRHTYASNQIAKGRHPKYICVQMGHYSISITMDIYGHLFPKEYNYNDLEAEKLESKNILDYTLSEIEFKQKELEKELELLNRRKNELNGTIQVKSFGHLRLVK